MWLDATLEPEWSELFKLTEEDYPAVIVLNPGKRKRWLKHQYDLTVDGVEKTLEKILGGDARFTRVKGNLPSFKTRATKE